MARKVAAFSNEPHDQPPLSLEMMLTSPDAFGLVTATNIQLAITRMAHGEPLGELWDDPDVQAAFGGVRPPEVAPHEVVLLMAIRCAKTMMAAAQAICATQNADVSSCNPGDSIRLPVLSTDKERADMCFKHIIGQLLSKPLLTQLIVHGPTADSVTLRHPSGHHIEIKVTAMARAGSTLVGAWLVGCIFDEAPRMAGEGSARSLEEARSAIGGRILPGGQIWYIGSPHAPFGAIYNMQANGFGKPTADRVIVRARGDKLNPGYWTQERQDDLLRRDPRAHRTDFLAEFADPEESLISSLDLEDCTRTALELPPQPGITYMGYMDPATRGNGWTLMVVGCFGFGGPHGQSPVYKVALATQWIGSQGSPLRPGAVLRAMADRVRPYGVTDVVTDQWSYDALRDLAEPYGIDLQSVTIGSDNRMRLAEAVSMLFRTRCLEIPPDPELRADLVAAQRRVTQNGVTLVMNVSSDGRHCDYLPPLMLLTAMPPDEPADAEPTNPHGEFAGIMAQLNQGAEETAWEKTARRLLSN